MRLFFFAKMTGDHEEYGGLIKAIAHKPFLLPIVVPCAMAFFFFPFLMEDTSNVFVIALVGYNLFAAIFTDAPWFVVAFIFCGGIGFNIAVLIACKDAALWPFSLLSLCLCGPFFVFTHLKTFIVSEREKEINVAYASSFTIRQETVAKYRKKHGGTFPKSALKSAMRKFEADHPNFLEDKEQRRAWKEHAHALLNQIDADDWV